MASSELSIASYMLHNQVQFRTLSIGQVLDASSQTEVLESLPGCTEVEQNERSDIAAGSRWCLASVLALKCTR